MSPHERASRDIRPRESEHPPPRVGTSAPASRGIRAHAHATLVRFGYRLILAPGLCMGVAIGAALQALRAVEHNGDRVPQLSPKELFDALGLPFWEDLRRCHELPSGDAAGVRG